MDGNNSSWYFHEFHHKLIFSVLGFMLFITIFQIIGIEMFMKSRFPPNIEIYGIKKYSDENVRRWFERDGGDSLPEIKSFEAILLKAGVEVTPEIRQKIPSVEKYTNIYGSKPIVQLDEGTCEKFKGKVKEGDRFIAPAGMFNTGTNLLEDLLTENCEFKISEATKSKTVFVLDRAVKAQVPWGKHSPVSWRFKHVAKRFQGAIQENFFPVLMIKDPLTFMDSICRHRYEAFWREIPGHCPNLVPINEKERKMIWPRKSFNVSIAYSKKNHNYTHHKSLAHLYNDYYGEWLKADFPKAVIRFEDLIFHTEYVVEKVCLCAGGKMFDRPFQYIKSSAKTGLGHKGSNGFLDSVLKYGNVSRRSESFSKLDLDFAKATLYSDILEAFNYTIPLDM